MHLVVDKKKVNFVIRKTFWCRYFSIDILAIRNLMAYFALLFLAYMTMWELAYDPSNIILFLIGIFVVWLSFYGENAFIKGKMKLKIISEVTK